MRFTLPAAFLLSLLFLSACSNRDSDENGATPSLAAASPDAGAAKSGQTPPSTSSGTPVSGASQHEAKNTIAHIQKLAGEIGARVSGTAGEKQAADYIAAQFRASGYNVEIMPFEFEDNPFKAGLVKVGGEDISALVMSGSGSGKATGRAIYVALADEAGIAGQDLKGAIAVADRGTLNFSVKYVNVKAAGAIGMVVVNNVDGLYPGNLTRTADFPVVGVAGEDRERLKRVVADKGSITIEVAAKSTGVNVVARPAAGAACDVVVGGHHDTVPAVPGATDNASGAAMTVELARAFAADGLDKGLCFVTFGGEESGLNGSQALIKQFQVEKHLPRYMVNLDVVATGTTIELIGDRELQSRAEAIGQKQGSPVHPTVDPANTSSDHASFIQAGIPAIFLAGDDYSMIHTPNDNLTVVIPKTVEQIGNLAFALIKELQAQVARG